MPYFPYKCEECEHEFNDLILNMTDKPKEELPCPECNAMAKKLKVWQIGFANATHVAWSRTDDK